METEEKLILVFIDLEAAFDSNERSIIWKCLEKMKMSSKLIRVIERTSADRKIGRIRMKSIKQGDNLSPVLFYNSK